jgi:hypothetical protein
MHIIVGGTDRHLSTTVAEILSSMKARCIRTHKIDRIITELKQPDRLVILDMSWEDLQTRGALKQLVNIGNISGNKVLCICPNTEEDLKKLAKSARPTEIFIRYDLYMEFKEYLTELLT